MLENDKCYGKTSGIHGGRTGCKWSGSLNEKVSFEQSCEGNEGLGVVAISGKSTPDRWISTCKGPEVGMCQDTSVARGSEGESCERFRGSGGFKQKGDMA